MTMKLQDIIIPTIFAESTPRKHKLDECRYWWNNFGTMDRYIVVNDFNVLIDGYILYCVLKENGYSGNISVKRSNVKKKKWRRKNIKISNDSDLNPMIYVYGKHCNNDKEYCWKILPKHSKDINNYDIGDKCLVQTIKGQQWVTITRILKSDQCPLDIPIKNVIRFKKCRG